jgi:hypothetical protein
MSEIKCPNCQTVFQIDESNYQDIVSQVRNNEFNEQVKQIREDAIKDKEKEVALSFEKANGIFKEELANKDKELIELKAKLEGLEKISEQKTKELVRNAEDNKEIVIKNLEVKINELNTEIDTSKLKFENEKMQALSIIEKERDAVKNELLIKEKDVESLESNIKQKYEFVIKGLEEERDLYKDFKARQSTKAIGESLEQYAMTEFDKLRSFAFKNATFEKDNDINSGTKGDFIYREYDDNDLEILSIMFEMKNEAEETTTKHKNEDFFKKLDKDRKDKKCEYAVLVSMLEADSDLYNSGIVDVSHKYEKMYVVRPQQFITIIGLLRNSALNTKKYRQELLEIKERDIDITNFEAELDGFKERFSKNYNLAQKHYQDAIERIDKSIRELEKVRESLTKSEDQLRHANKKLDDVNIKKLTKDNPTMQEKFASLENKEKKLDNKGEF